MLFKHSSKTFREGNTSPFKDESGGEVRRMKKGHVNIKLHKKDEIIGIIKITKRDPRVVSKPFLDERKVINNHSYSQRSGTF